MSKIATLNKSVNIQKEINYTDTRYAQILAIMISNAEADTGLFSLTKNELIEKLEQHNIITGKYAPLRVKHALQILEKRHLIARLFRAAEFTGNVKARMGMHFVYAFINLNEIKKLLSILPKNIPEPEVLAEKISLIKTNYEQHNTQI